MKNTNLVKGLLAVVALVVMAAVSVPAEAQQSQFPIAVVDVNRVFKDSKQGKAIDKNLKDKGTKLEKEMQAKETELNTMATSIEQDARSGKLTQEAFEKKRNDFQTKAQAFQTQRSKAFEDMNKATEDALKPLQTKTEKAITDIAKTKGYVVVLNSMGVVYAPDAIDITAEVIKAVDK